MKTQPPTHRHPIWTSLWASALCLPASLAFAAPLLTDDFESYTADTPVPTGGNWTNVTFASGSLAVRDQNTATPFGTPNRYVEFVDPNDTDSIRLQSQSFAAASNALTTFSFDFFEPGSGGDGQINVGYAIDNTDLIGTSRRIHVTLDDGMIANVSGGTSTYAIDTAYRLHIIFNDTASTVNYSAGSIASGSADVWLENPSTGIFTFAGTTGSQNTGTDETGYNVAFRSFSGALQSFHLDNVSLVEGAPEIPILEDDFESYTADAAVPTGGNWANASFGTSSLLVRDETTASPFGTPNQYVEFADTDTSGVRLQSRTFTAASNALTTFSFDFFEPGSGGPDAVNVGYAIDNLELLSATRRINVTLDNGVIGGLSGGVSTAYNVDTPYRLHIIHNDTASTVTYAGGTVASGTAAVWLENPSTGTFTFAGTRAAENLATVETSYSVAFRTTTTATQTIHLDNISLVKGAPDIPMIGDSFESYTADATIATGGFWTNLTTAGGSVTVRDETTSIPFGTPNQYLEFDDTSDTTGLRLQSRIFATASNAVTTFAFDFLEPSTGGSQSATVGYAIDNGDVNTATGRVILTLNNGTLGGGLTGGTSTYDVNTAYRLYMIFNDSGATVDYPGGSVADGTAAVWLKNLTSETFTFAGAINALNPGTAETSYSVGFRCFNANMQSLLLDNVTFAMGAAAIPDSPGTSGFDSWRTANSATGQTLADDHDGDGVANGVEYFLGGPGGDTTGFTPLPGVTNNAGTLSVTWTMDAGYTGVYGTDFVVETSATLADPWTNETEGVNVTITGDDVKYTFPPGTKNFARLRVTGP